MLSDRCLGELRRSSTLTHLYPALTTTLSFDGDPLVVVGWRTPIDELMTDVRAVHPCAFRKCVAQAWEFSQGGGRLDVLGLHGDPCVDVTAGPGGRVWPSGIIRLPLVEHSIYLMSTTLDQETCRDVVERWGDAADHDRAPIAAGDVVGSDTGAESEAAGSDTRAGDVKASDTGAESEVGSPGGESTGGLDLIEAIGIRADAETGVTVVHVDVRPVASLSGIEPELLDHLEDLLSQLVVAELLADLATTSSEAGSID